MSEGASVKLVAKRERFMLVTAMRPEELPLVGDVIMLGVVPFKVIERMWEYEEGAAKRVLTVYVTTEATGSRGQWLGCHPDCVSHAGYKCSCGRLPVRESRAATECLSCGQRLLENDRGWFVQLQAAHARIAELEAQLAARGGA